MRRLFGLLVLVALVVFGVSYVASHWPTGSRFGCRGATGPALAHADADCPVDITQADDDATWAAARIRSIPRTGSTATGLFYDPDGHETRYTSERNANSDNALNVGRAARVFPDSGRPNVVDHVEVKATAAMRASGVVQGVLVINNAAGPCGQDIGGPYSCSAVVPRLLPAGSSLVVWWPGADSERPDHRTFMGGAR